MNGEDAIEKIARIIEQLKNGEITANLANEIRKPFDRIIGRHATKMNKNKDE